MPKPSFGISIFSDVNKSFVIVKSKKISSAIFIFLPLIISLIINYFFLGPRLSGLFSNPPSFEFNIAVLTGCGIVVILLTSIGYFYQKGIFKVQDPNIIKSEIHDIMKMAISGKEDIKVAFAETSAEDLNKIVTDTNITLRYIHQWLYIIEVFLVFLCLFWALFDFPLASMPSSIKVAWQGMRFPVGFSIVFSLFMYMFFHSLVIAIQCIFKTIIKICVNSKNIQRKWEQYQADLSSTKSGELDKAIERLKDKL